MNYILVLAVAVVIFLCATRIRKQFYSEKPYMSVITLFILAIGMMSYALLEIVEKIINATIPIVWYVVISLILMLAPLTPRKKLPTKS